MNYETAPPSTARPEIVFELSDDGEAYVPMEFSHKPGAVDAMPGIVAPHQVRRIRSVLSRFASIHRKSDTLFVRPFSYRSRSLAWTGKCGLLLSATHRATLGLSL